MPLKDAVSTEDNTRCSVGLALKVLDPEDRDELLSWLGTKDDWGKSARVIFEDFNRYARANNLGITIAFQTINKHRGGTCGCAK